MKYYQEYNSWAWLLLETMSHTWVSGFSQTNMLLSSYESYYWVLSQCFVDITFCLLQDIYVACTSGSSVKDCLRCVIAPARHLSQLMLLSVIIITIQPREYLHWNQYNTFVVIKKRSGNRAMWTSLKKCTPVGQRSAPNSCLLPWRSFWRYVSESVNISCYTNYYKIRQLNEDLTLNWNQGTEFEKFPDKISDFC